MGLRKFIAETSTQIIGGITDAQANIIEFRKDGDSDYTAPYTNPNPTSDHSKKLSDIEFDVAVTVSEGNSAEGGGGLSVMGVSIDGKGVSEQTKSSVSRIKFSIPVSYGGNFDILHNLFPCPFLCAKKTARLLSRYHRVTAKRVRAKARAGK